MIRPIITTNTNIHFEKTFLKQQKTWCYEHFFLAATDITNLAVAIRLAGIGKSKICR